MRQDAVGGGNLGQLIERAVAAVDFAQVRQAYWDQEEFVFLEHFLPPAAVREHLLPALERLRPAIHRSYIPRFKKGGSVSFYTIRERAPIFLELYRSPALRDFLSRLVDARLTLCPEKDPHSCALYFYTEPGDHIGFHYDTSYYKGARYTVLLGLIQRSAACRLVCQLHRGQPGREPRELALVMEPGSLVLFNGEKLWHAVTPLEDGEERVSLTMEYVTDPGMAPLHRLVSNLKDAFAYFGVRTLLRRR